MKYYPRHWERMTTLYHSAGGSNSWICDVVFIAIEPCADAPDMGSEPACNSTLGNDPLMLHIPDNIRPMVDLWALCHGMIMRESAP
jgi:hypothetical protein